VKKERNVHWPVRAVGGTSTVSRELQVPKKKVKGPRRSNRFTARIVVRRKWQVLVTEGARQVTNHRGGLPWGKKHRVQRRKE